MPNHLGVGVVDRPCFQVKATGNNNSPTLRDFADVKFRPELQALSPNECYALLENFLPTVAGEGTSNVKDVSMIIMVSWIRFLAQRLYTIDGSICGDGSNGSQAVYKDFNDSEDIVEKLVDNFITMASSLTARTISTRSLLVDQIAALGLDPTNKTQSMALLKVWGQRGLLFPSFYNPNPNSKKQAYWLVPSGKNFAICLNPDDLDRDAREYWNHAARAERNAGPRTKYRHPEMDFTDYTGETVTYIRDHPHIEKIAKAKHWFDRQPSEAKQTHSTQDALYTLLCDVLGVCYPGGIDLFRPSSSNDYSTLKPEAKRKKILSTFVFTIDNVFKMLAVYFRLQAQMPVVIMGETGCGKTYSITYLATLLAMPFYQVHLLHEPRCRTCRNRFPSHSKLRTFPCHHLASACLVACPSATHASCSTLSAFLVARRARRAQHR